MPDLYFNMVTRFSEILNAVATTIEDIGIQSYLTPAQILAGETSEPVPISIQKVLTDKPLDDLVLPHILVSVDGEERYTGTGTNERDDIVYPVVVWMLDRARQDYGPDGWDNYLEWRDAIRAVFHHRRLYGTTDPMNPTTANQYLLENVWNVVVEPKAVVLPQSFRVDDLYASGLKILVTSREPRGLSAPGTAGTA